MMQALADYIDALKADAASRGNATTVCAFRTEQGR
jgi:hypothetical protein